MPLELVVALVAFGQQLIAMSLLLVFPAKLDFGMMHRHYEISGEASFGINKQSKSVGIYLQAGAGYHLDVRSGRGLDLGLGGSQLDWDLCLWLNLILPCSFGTWSYTLRVGHLYPLFVPLSLVS